MDRTQHSTGRFRAALTFSVLLHLGVAAGSLFSGGLESPSALAAAPRVTELLYVGRTGPTLNLPLSADQEGQGGGRPVQQIRRLRGHGVTGEASDERSRGQRDTASEGQENDAKRSPHPLTDQAMQPYLDQIRSRLSRKIRFPKGAGSQELILNFSVSRSGTLTGYRLTSPAAAVLQEQAIRGLKAAAPFPPLPGDWNRSEVVFTVRLLFSADSV